MKLFEQLEEVMSIAKEDAEKFYQKKNGSAGVRLRKYLQEVKRISQEIRVEVSELKKK